MTKRTGPCSPAASAVRGSPCHSPKMAGRHSKNSAAAEVTADWRFIPSSQLGGDAFGYHWPDPDHFAVYLLDVCSHGVGAALLSISVMNVLRSQSLPDADFRNPGEVLSSLNRTFPMERQNNLYFTMWYGVFNRPACQLSYASGGHPPA